jgi:hypothetical protein
VPLAFQCKNAAASIGMGLPAAVISRRAAASQLLRGDAKVYAFGYLQLMVVSGGLLRS